MDKADVVSRNGNSSGYGVSFSPNSTGLLIYLPGGRACFDAFSCSTNLGDYGEAEFNENGVPDFPLFNRANLSGNANNLFKDWNHLFIAYSSGDVYAGDNEGVDVPNGGDDDQTFKGYQNFRLVLEEYLIFIDEQGLELTEVILAGSSAGGYGVLANFDQMATLISNKFSDVQYTLINDAGYLLIDEAVVPDCLNQDWQNTFNIQIPADINEFSQPNFAFNFLSIYEYLDQKYPTANFGFFGSYSDVISRTLLSLGQENCAYQVGLIEAEAFKASLLTQQEQLLANLSRWRVYYRQSEEHTILRAPDYFSLTVNDKKFIDWVNELHAGTAEDVIAP
ncbi:MAG: pectin acetylesterase-family hydrolase [Bacteroidota bacterium]